MYKPTLKSGGKGGTWWIKFYTDGRCVRESTGTTSEQQARRILRDREGRAVRGEAVLPRANSIRLAELADDVRNDYRAKRRRSGEKLEDVLAHVLGALGNRRAQSVTTADVVVYVTKRQEEGAANATINRELAALKRMFRLAMRGAKLHQAPAIDMLPESNARQGFVEPATFEAIARHLPPVLADVARFAYVTGWRKQEVLTLAWADVDREHRVVTLRGAVSKNGEPRRLPLTSALAAIVERRWEARTVAQPDGSTVLAECVFHHAGRSIGGLRKSWRTSCRRAGVPGLLFHDLRRSAVRNFDRAGVSQTVAMSITGHKTADVYRRYRIVDEQDVRDALTKTEAATAADGTAAHVAKVIPLRAVQ